MKIDYNQLMLKEISSLGDKPRLLLHCCCAPCSSAVIERLIEHFDITFFYYNPNIYPQEEYETRKKEFDKLNVNITSLEYIHQDFLDKVIGLEQEREGGDRCRACIAMRMDRAFAYAKEKGYDYVTTTLSISPHKDAQFINETGDKLQSKYDIKYLYADFKKQNGYLRSIEICRDLGIYRQDYCGCEFSRSNTKK
ncbi:MAG: epoxyqueuosine reductase QueH [Clostridiales bacterium]|nr:epoxyqueuosine reductase QueH [Clostridiales bacterium]